MVEFVWVWVVIGVLHKRVLKISKHGHGRDRRLGFCKVHVA